MLLIDKLGLVECVPAYDRGVGISWSLRSLPTQIILWFDEIDLGLNSIYNMLKTGNVCKTRPHVDGSSANLS